MNKWVDRLDQPHRGLPSQKYQRGYEALYEAGRKSMEMVWLKVELLSPDLTDKQDGGEVG